MYIYIHISVHIDKRLINLSYALISYDIFILYNYFTCTNFYLGALIPFTEKNGDFSMLLHRLPFSDDIRNYDFPSFNLECINNTQQDNIRLFVDNKTILNPMDSILNPYNYIKNLIYNEIQKKLLMLNNSEISICDINDPLHIKSPGFYIYVYAYIYTYTRILICIHIYIYVYVCINLYQYVYASVYTYICMYTFVYVYIYIYIYTHIFIFTFIHISRCQSGLYFDQIESLFSVKSFC
jgi:hypothetical protein